MPSSQPISFNTVFATNEAGIVRSVLISTDYDTIQTSYYFDYLLLIRSLYKSGHDYQLHSDYSSLVTKYFRC